MNLREKSAGIYVIVNRENWKFYVGSAKSLRARIACHKSQLSTGDHCNRHLSSAWKKYGSEAFTAHIVEQCDAARLIEREQFWIDTLAPDYNLAQIAGSSLGYKMTDNQRETVSRGAKARLQRDPEHHAAITAKANAKMKELWATDEYRDRMTATINASSVKLQKQIAFNGVTKSRQEWAADLGITATTLDHRLKNWTIAEALTTAGQGQWAKGTYELRVARQGKLVELDGKPMTLTDLCNELGTTRASFNDYRKKHSHEDSVAFFRAGGGKARLNRIEFRGEMLTISEIARATGENFQRLWRRVVKQGMDVEVALTVTTGEVMHNRAVLGHKTRCANAKAIEKTSNGL